MLNRSKVMRELHTVREQLFVDSSREYKVARRLWEQVCSDPTLPYKIKSIDTALLIPHWEGTLNTIIPLKEYCEYTAISVDGSQIYPDKHQGTPCYLLNIGEVAITYGKINYPVFLNSEPYLFTGHELNVGELKIDLINLQRHEFEFQAALNLLSAMSKDRPEYSSVGLLDGSLIFWHLDSKDPLHKDYLIRYLAILENFYTLQLLVASYISLPKSKELSNILRLVLSDCINVENDLTNNMDNLLDTTVANFFLPPYSRTILFKHTGPIVHSYAAHLQPYFFYIHVGSEIGRVEIPAWIAHDKVKVDCIASIILSQSMKGTGYPVVLAEAHEQAVVKGADRDFFYHLITKSALEQKRSLIKSQKSIKKRGIRI